MRTNNRPDQSLPAPEGRDWLDADLSRLGEFEPYDWGPHGPPQAQPVGCEPGRGIIVGDSSEG